MKKITHILLFVVVLLLTACVKIDIDYALPNLDGLTREEITTIFEDMDALVEFDEAGIPSETTEFTFFEYGNNKESGQMFDKGVVTLVLIYPDFVYEEVFFTTIDMDYDGPRLEESFMNIDPINPRGGYFEVTLKYCTDGDTAVFNYPQDIYDAITSSAKSVRFLNMDTEETYSGGEEEWGKPASAYTCSLLEGAETLVLQTDPGDSLLGTYGRLLAWVWIQLPNEDDFQLLNYIVVKQGLAQVKYEFGAGETISYGDNTYNEWMHIAEDYAMINELGQWGELLDPYWDYEYDSLK